ncbi:hypothetical protein GGR58DRAFT_528552 [Xylaria digitata]|nr:hypothetical protein GGR58DRAFT_528552 [Xylaria digitata]
MVSPVHSVGGEDEAPPPSESPDRKTRDTTLEMREIYPDPRNPTDKPPLGVSSDEQATLPRPGPSASSRAAADMENQTKISSWWNVPFTNLLDRTRRAEIKPTVPSENISQRPEATEGDQGGANVVGSARTTHSEAKAPPFPAFVPLSEFSGPQVDVDIIAVHDLEQTVATAWTDAVEKQRPRRPAGPNSEPTALHQEKHTRSWNDETDGGRKTEDAMQRDKDLVVPAGESNVVSEAKGKRKVGGSENTPIQQSLVQQRAQPPAVGESGEKNPGDDDHISYHSNRLQVGKDLKLPLEMDKGPKLGNWLTDDKMLANDLKRARVQAFPYNSPEKLDESKSLRETISSAAKGILFNLRKGMEARSSIPLVFIAIGFGCLIVQELIALIDEDSILDTISAIIFFDAPNTLSKEHYTQENGKPALNLPLPSSARRAAHRKIKKKELPTVWFYIAADASNPTATLPHAASVKFVHLIQASTNPNDPLQLRSLGPSEPNYISFIHEIKRCLLFKASSHKKFDALLAQLIEGSYDLNVRDYKKRCPLHRAAECGNDTGLMRLIAERSDLVNNQDQDGLTPLHSAVKEAIRITQDDIEIAPFQCIIEILLDKLDENQLRDDIKDNSGNSPWDYIRKNSQRWIKELKDDRFLPIGELTNGARVARPETLKHMIAQANVGNSKQDNICRQSNALLTQFYIEEGEDNNKDSLYLWRYNIYEAIYDKNHGTRKLFATPSALNKNTWATCKWIHLPANNEKWVHDLFLLQFRCNDDSTRARRHRGSAPFDRHIAPGVFKYIQTHELCSEQIPHGAPSITVTSADGTSTGKRTVTALFMPVFGFETDGNRRKLSEAIEEASSLSEDDSPPSIYESVDEDDADTHNRNLIQAYYKEDEFPLHCRRTLDQFTYYMLHDTALRGTSQVMFKWQKEKEEQEEKLIHRREPSGTLTYPLLMIDQLWLWILEDKQTVITSFPNTWESSNGYNLIRHLSKDKLKSNNHRQLINGSMDLANLIIQGSIDFLHRKGPCDATMYKSFRSKIISIAARHNDRFHKFNELVGKLNENGIDQETKAELTNDLFQQTAKTDLLTEIMDVEDELNTIQHVLSKQRDVIDAFALLVDKQHKAKVNKNGNTTQSPRRPWCNPTFSRRSRRQNRRSKLPLPAPPGAQTHDDQVINLGPNPSEKAGENLRLVKSNIITISELQTHAKKVRVEIEGLLSRMQKQANAWEARFAREGSEHTQYQSNITLVFTIVTVFFLPLSFISSVFAIQIDIFPHDEKTGELNWPVREAMGLLFGISFGVILLVALLGFRIHRISRFFVRHSNRVSSKWEQWWRRKKEEAEDELTNTEYSSTTGIDHGRASSIEPQRRKREDQARRASGSVVFQLLPWNWRGNTNSGTGRSGLRLNADTLASVPDPDASVRVAGGFSVRTSWGSDTVSEEEESWGNREISPRALFSLLRRRKAKVDDIESGWSVSDD